MSESAARAAFERGHQDCVDADAQGGVAARYSPVAGFEADYERGWNAARALLDRKAARWLARRAIGLGVLFFAGGIWGSLAGGGVIYPGACLLGIALAAKGIYALVSGRDVEY